MFNINTDFTEAKNKTKELSNFLNNLEKEINEDSLKTLYALHDVLKIAELNSEPAKDSSVGYIVINHDITARNSVLSNNAVQTAPEVAVSSSMPISPFVA